MDSDITGQYDDEGARSGALGFHRFAERVMHLLGLQVAANALSQDASLQFDLALDSFQMLQVILVIEAIADVAVPPADMPKLTTLLDAFEYFEQLSSQPG